MNKKTYFYLLVFSFLTAVCLGMMDYETESLWHLFTAEWGNILALLMYTVFFFFVGWCVVRIYRLIRI